MSTPRWFYAQDDNRLGPVAVEQIAQLVMKGDIARDALVWRHGLTDWTEASRVPEIASLLPPPLPPPGGKATRAAAEAESKPAPSDGEARFDEIRKQLEADANPRRYAQVAEDLRKEGDFPNSIRVCREGLDRYAYPSLRLTLARALLEGGDAKAARAELETVLQAAPDNIVARRLHGECLQALGESPAPPPVPEPAPEPVAARPARKSTPPAAPATPPVPPAPPAPPAAVAPPPPAPPPAVEAAPAPAPSAKANKKTRPEPPPANIADLPTLDARPGTVKEIEKALEITEEPAPGVAWPSGRLTDHEFPDLVREVYGRRWTGLLTLNHMGAEKGIRVQDGRLVFATSSIPDDRLGELLLRRGRITLQQYVDAGAAIRKGGKRLGAILVEMGALDARELVKVVVDHTLEIIYGAFQWTEGLYHFTEAVGGTEDIVLKLSTPEIILEGIRRIDRWSRIERAVGGLETRYERVDGYQKLMPQMTLSPDKQALLTDLATPKDLGTICRQSALPHFETCRTLWAFRVIGAVRRMD